MPQQLNQLPVGDKGRKAELRGRQACLRCCKGGEGNWDVPGGMHVCINKERVGLILPCEKNK